MAPVASGTVSTLNDQPLALRLRALFEGLTDIVAAHGPDETAVEATFVNKDAAGTLKLGQARGMALLVPALADLPVAEYAPNQIKKTVTGVGHADKTQIAAMVKMLLPKSAPATEHECDAYAIAICHAQHRTVSEAALGRRMRVSA